MTSIRAIATELPAVEVTNADLDRENPSWGMGLVAQLTGIESRRVTAVNETALDLSVRACERLREQAHDDLTRIDAILCCTHEPDYLSPGNAQLLHNHLGLGDDVLAFDYRLACSGFVYGLAFADALARAGAAREILLVTAETQSKCTHPRDRSVRVLFGDGAAVTHVSARDEGGGEIVASELCTHGRGFMHACIPGGGARIPSSEGTREALADREGNIRGAEDIHMDGMEVWAFVRSTLPGHIEAFLARHSLTVADVDLCVFHQASKMVLDSLAKDLGLPREKMFLHLSEIGNLSSASIPFALEAALDQGAIGPGSLVLLSGFGAGISYGSMIVQY